MHLRPHLCTVQISSSGQSLWASAAPPAGRDLQPLLQKQNWFQIKEINRLDLKTDGLFFCFECLKQTFVVVFFHLIHSLSSLFVQIWLRKTWSMFPPIGGDSLITAAGRNRRCRSNDQSDDAVHLDRRSMTSGSSRDAVETLLVFGSGVHVPLKAQVCTSHSVNSRRTPPVWGGGGVGLFSCFPPLFFFFTTLKESVMSPRLVVMVTDCCDDRNFKCFIISHWSQTGSSVTMLLDRRLRPVSYLDYSVI